MTDNILHVADKLTSEDRIGAYSHPFDDYTCTSGIWTYMLRHAGVLREDAEITPELAILMMSGMKISRLSQNITHMDSITDNAGYARCLQLAIEERDRRRQLAEELSWPERYAVDKLAEWVKEETKDGHIQKN